MHLLRKSQGGLTRVELLVLVSIVLLIAAIAIPGLLTSQRASNERNASTTLKTFSAAEADFRANDRDGNHVNDFWTADVKGLYTMTSPEGPGPGAVPGAGPIKLIELSVAAADADGNQPSAGGANMPLSRFAAPAPKGGYWFVALIEDQSAGDAKPEPYKVDTKGSPIMGPVHNTLKFGFAAFPHLPSMGKYLFRVNENNTIFREATTGPSRKGTARPPGLDSIPAAYLNWPPDKEANGKWGGPLD
jgi:type II secretory pathway pseudopilin PulG